MDTHKEEALPEGGQGAKGEKVGTTVGAETIQYNQTKSSKRKNTLFFFS